MFEKLKKRYITCFVVIIIIAVVMSISLYTLVAKGEQFSGSKNTATVTVAGRRGSIYDKNGILLAYDKDSYNVTFYKDPKDNASSDRAHYTAILRKTIEIIESNGDTIIDTFLIKKDENGEFAYSLSSELTEEQRQARIDRWCSNMQISDATMEPEDIYFDLRSRFRIPESCDYEEAVKLLSIWQEVQNYTYQSYRSVIIAKDVNIETVHELENKASELKGIAISEGYVRKYPKNDMAAHIIGHLGRINSDDVLKQMQAKGYNAEDLIGEEGIENTMESYLSGCTTEKQGRITYLLDRYGSVIGIDSTVPAKEGNSVVLTIDIGLQEVAEEALAENVKKIRREQERNYANNSRKYDRLLSQRGVKELAMAEAGAAIVIEVKTGNVLALVSYPSYDLNLFTGGISEEKYKELMEQGPTFFNNAIASTSTPGSIFKMATAVAGLMEGEIGVNTVIVDKGPYDKYVTEGATAPACWAKPYYHGSQTVVSALKNSCNYFFFDVADRLGIERLTEWVGHLGLTKPTGIQLPGEKVGFIGGPKIKYDPDLPLNEQKTSIPLLVYSKIKEQLKGYGKVRGVEYSEAQIEEATMALIDLARLQSLSIGPEIRQVLSEKLDIPSNVTLQRGWTSDLMSTLIELIWTPTDTVTQGIGATPTQVTPIAVARYLCAISNGGKVLEANIIDKVIDENGNVVYEHEPVVVEDLQLPEEYSKAIMQGMEEVVSWENRGTAGSAFKGFKYQKILAGKTGTAPISNIDMEDNVWFVLVAPKDDPEIAVVLFVPNGLSDSKVYDTAKAIITYYFDNKELEG
ncbi:MAG: hypothetical protein IKI62_04710 [Clostridia bacterium]|nr:hypothetical protein [Clostridia bacterium]